MQSSFSIFVRTIVIQKEATFIATVTSTAASLSSSSSVTAAVVGKYTKEKKGYLFVFSIFLTIVIISL